MNKIIYLVSVGFFILCTQCKNENKNPLDTSSNTASKTESTKDPLTVPVPEGYYKPEGLRPLTMMEMYELGSTQIDFVKSLHLKDKSGNDVSHSVLEDVEKPMFVQMYADENNKVVEAVVYELTDEMKTKIMKMRMGAPRPK
jgi:hypothetical protein